MALASAAQFNFKETSLGHSPRQQDYASAAQFARERDPFSHESKRAVVAPKRAMYETAKMYKLIRKDENIVLFKTVDEAKDWLGLSTNS